MLAARRLAKREACWAPWGQRRNRGLYGPKTLRRPLPRTPWTLKGPPPGGALPWYLRRPPPVRVQLPELDAVTYAEKLYPVPWLAKPTFPKWERGWDDPYRRQSRPIEELPDYKTRPCYEFHRRSRLQEGVKQALWLTKAKLIKGLPSPILNIMNDITHQLEDQDERILNAISRARFWAGTEDDVSFDKYSPVLLEDLLHLCRSMTVEYPSLNKRMMSQDYRATATWERESSLIQINITCGKLLNAENCLQPIASGDEILATEDHDLETFYPISPIIDLREKNVYKIKNETGFNKGYPYPYPHTAYTIETGKREKSEHLQARVLMFAFGNALAKAKKLYGDEPKVLEKPVVVQSIGTNGQAFHFVVFQLNTTDLDSSNGVKNLAWLDADQLLYEDARKHPEIKKKIVLIPAGIHGYNPDTFKKFLALYLHGVV
ncbi:39S ribosomal protein L37, mitochondrial [Crotalus tigris]|uniref:39S ribosomal protein L37, mitochondrial n=1 Tax=Crotalus tigris TaxID=88082 RepID=UPI00192F13CB|nr:39S ribosomal protein L37, mitochondrial [Crotalus tigris]